MDDKGTSPDATDTGPAVAPSPDRTIPEDEIPTTSYPPASSQPAPAPADTTTAPAATDDTKFDRSQLDAKGGFASIGHELDETAPLWRVYRDEVRNHDQNVTLDEWNKTLDVLLIFAGLFSAVVTTFVVATFPLLNPQDDNVAIAIYMLARSINNATEFPAPEPAGPATTSSLWVNGLWFTSLFVALAVAFFAILAKQWLVEYNHRMADPPATGSVAGAPSATTSATATPTASLTWARRRNFFFEGFDKWHIPALITQVLPFLMHIALFLFLVGLALFVWTLNRHIAFGITTLTVLLIGLYTVSTVLPMWWWDCPTATPLVRQLRGIPALLVVKVLAIFDRHSLSAAEEPDSRLPPPSGSFLPRRLTRVQTVVGAVEKFRRSISEPKWNDQKQTTMSVTCRTLRWLILVSGSESATAIALQSLGSLNPQSVVDFLPDLQTIANGLSALGSLPSAPSAVEVIRAIRTELLLGRGSWAAPLLGLDLTPSMLVIVRSSYWPDAQLLWAALNYRGDHISSVLSSSTLSPAEVPEWLSTLRDISPGWRYSQAPLSLSSTALLLLRSKEMPLRILPYLLSLILANKEGDEDLSAFSRVCNPIALGNTARCAVRNSPGHRQTCDLSCVISLVCRTLNTGDDTDCKIGAWVVLRVLRGSRESLALHHLRALGTWLFDSNAQVSDNLHTFLDGDTAPPEWLYRSVMVFTLASLGHTVWPLLHLLDRGLEDRLAFLLWPLEIEMSSTGDDFVLPREIWVKLLICILTNPYRQVFGLSELAQLLAITCMLKRRGHVDRAALTILNDQIDCALETIDVVDFLHLPHTSHFLLHFAEIEPAWVKRLERLRNHDIHFSQRLASIQELLESRVCTYCPGLPPGPFYARLRSSRARVDSQPPTSILSTRGPDYPLARVAPDCMLAIQVLLDQEMGSPDDKFVVPSVIWVRLLIDATSNLPYDMLSPSTLVLLFAGACMLKRRGVAIDEELSRGLAIRLDDCSAGTAQDQEADMEHLLMHVWEFNPSAFYNSSLITQTMIDNSVMKHGRFFWERRCGNCPGTLPDNPVGRVAEELAIYGESVAHWLLTTLSNSESTLRDMIAHSPSHVQGADDLGVSIPDASRSTLPLDSIFESTLRDIIVRSAPSQVQGADRLGIAISYSILSRLTLAPGSLLSSLPRRRHTPPRDDELIGLNPFDLWTHPALTALRNGGRTASDEIQLRMRRIEEAMRSAIARPAGAPAEARNRRPDLGTGLTSSSEVESSSHPTLDATHHPPDSAPRDATSSSSTDVDTMVMPSDSDARFDSEHLDAAPTILTRVENSSSDSRAATPRGSS